MYCPYAGMMGGFGWLMMTGTTIVVLALLGLGAYLLIRATRPSGAATTSSADQILAERFARGEIDETEYQQRLATLRNR
jgi:putative membrane protein